MEVRTNEVVLTESQKNCVRFKPKGSLLIRGIPGSGKTTILLERARFLCEKEMASDNPGVLFLTYSRSLASYVRQLSLKTGEEPVSVSTFHQWGIQLLRSLYPGLKFVEDKEEVVRHAFNTVKKYDKEVVFPKFEENKSDGRKINQMLVKFLSEEISWIKGQGIETEEEYLNVKRSGRGNRIHVTMDHRKSIFKVFIKYNELLKNLYRCIDYDDAAILLDKHRNDFDEDMLPKHILIDEAQDLTPLQLKVLRDFAQESLTIGADKGQQIYRRNFSWKSLGIDVTGRRSKFLNETFRSTVEIIRLANSLQIHDKKLMKDEEYVVPVLPQFHGPIPMVYKPENRSVEVEIILSEIKKILNKNPDHTIGLIGYSDNYFNKFIEAMDEAGISWIKVKDRENEANLLSPGVKLVTFYSSKGLEFDHVMITGVKEGNLPSKHIQPGEDEEDFIALERRKFYVAMTRARISLIISAPKPVSRFVDELDETLYELKS